jgi:hypothetical protein
MKEELYKWYPIVGEGEYWTDYDTSIFSYNDSTPRITTIVTNGFSLYTFEECSLDWDTMAKSGDWKYMRVKIN